MITPIILPINTGSHEPVKTKCPKCHHEWVEENDFEWWYIPTILLMIVVGVAALFFISETLFMWTSDGVPLFKAIAKNAAAWWATLTNLV